jgi:uncharacterized protein involved in exopolysaccharide biosynthesis
MVGGSPNDGIATMRDKLFQLQVQQEEVKSKFQAAHPKYIALQAQVDEMTALLKKENPDRPQILQAILAADNSSKAAFVAQKQSLQSQLLELRNELMALNESEIQVTQSEMKLKHAESKYMAFATKTEDARIDSALLKDKISNVQVIQPASMSVLPVGPQKLNILVLSFVFGVAGGIALALLSDQWARFRAASQKQNVRRRARGFKFTRVVRT